MAALLYGSALHHLDHLAPLSQFLSIPLFVTDEEIYLFAQKFYPELSVQHIEPLRVGQVLVEKYSRVVSPLPRAVMEELLFFAERSLSKTISTIWCPHGYSDKGCQSGFMKHLSQEEHLFLYGTKMVDELTSLGVISHKKNYTLLGHYRYIDYLIHKVFYDQAIEQVLAPLKGARKTYLYAPTWIDSENSSSFSGVISLLIEKLPKDVNLIIKPHPNLEIQEGRLLFELETSYQGHPHLLFLKQCPLIFPLLAKSDLYLGDASSIGYDYLAFDRPLILFNPNRRDIEKDRGLYLHRAAVSLKPEEYAHIYERVESLFAGEDKLFSPLRKKVYSSAFSSG